MHSKNLSIVDALLYKYFKCIIIISTNLLDMTMFNISYQIKMNTMIRVNRNSLQTNSDSLKISRAICTALEHQSYQIDTFENNLYITDQMVNQTKHIVRGMTWFGWLINKFISKPIVDTEYQKNPTIHTILSYKEYQPTRFIASQQPLLVMTKMQRINTASDNEETDFLNELSNQLIELKHTSKMIGECLDKQLNQIDDIESKLFKTQMNMKKLNIKIDNF